MAVKLKDVVEEMKTVLAARDGGLPGRRGARILGLAGDFLSTALAGEARNGQTAILLTDRDGSHLSFVFPEHLARGNVFPIDQQSIAGQVVLTGRMVVENDMPREPHKDFFERIPNASGEVRTIQKMIASPLFGRDGSVFGVVEVSRTGGENAGPEANFTARDARNLETCCRVFAPFIARARADVRGW